MWSLEWIAATLIAAFELIAAIILNLYIMATSFLDQSKKFSLSPANQMYFYMGLVNVCLQVIMTLQGYVYVFSPVTYVSKEFSVPVCLCFLYFIYLNLWLTAWLCSFYCVTIVRFRSKFVTRLKMSLSTVVPKLLLITAVGCVIISVPSIWGVQVVAQQNMTQELTHNIHNFIVVFNFTHYYFIIFITFGCSLPLVLSLTSVGFTLTSLFGYIWRIKVTESSLSAPQLEAHYKACRTMLRLIITYLVFIVSEIHISTSILSTSNILMVATFFIALLYPTSQSAILIFGNPRLKKGFVGKEMCQFC
ncbi:taste receptor type 2 member 40-like [Bombina bombina]|uniref:taste receptor type 2 member 40-like n=1 Tax=Bombina bombina TaxID=8345 RepID=UPI00235A5EAA|nr:taste receptor type 2 member 40-like [Bombina bombina]